MENQTQKVNRNKVNRMFALLVTSFITKWYLQISKCYLDVKGNWQGTHLLEAGQINVKMLAARKLLTIFFIVAFLM